MSLEKQKTNRQNTAWNVVFGYVNIALALVRNILLVPLYLQFITLEMFGAWLATGSALINIVMTDFGLAGATLQRIAYLDGKKDYLTLRYSLGTSILSGVLLSISLSILTFLVAPFIASSLELGPIEYEVVYNCIVLAILANALSVPGMIALGVLKSVRSPITAGLIYAIIDIISILLTVYLLFAGKGLYSIAIGLVARAFLLMIAGIFFGIRTCMQKYNINPAISIEESKVLLKNSLYLFVSSIAMKVQTQADTFFVGVLIGPTSAGIYGLTVRAYEAVHMAINQINRGIAPALANMHGVGDTVVFNSVLLKFTKLILFMSAIGMSCLLLLNESFVSLWVGDEKYAGNLTTYLLVASGFIMLISSISYDVACSQAKFKFIACVFFLAAFLHVFLIYYILEYFGYQLTPVARLITSFVWGMVYWLVIYKNNSSSKSDLLKLALQTVAIFTLSIFIILLVVSFEIKIENWIDFLVYSFAYASLFFITILISIKDIRLLVFSEFNKLKGHS